MTTTPAQLNQLGLKSDEDEISIKDIFNFLIEHWKLILVFECFGLFFATILLVFATPQYEARAQVRMGQILLPSLSMGNIPNGINDGKNSQNGFFLMWRSLHP